MLDDREDAVERPDVVRIAEFMRRASGAPVDHSERALIALRHDALAKRADALCRVAKDPRRRVERAVVRDDEQRDDQYERPEQDESELGAAKGRRDADTALVGELLRIPEAEATRLLEELEAAGCVASATGPVQ
jgi:hypothetical protein